LNDSFASFKNDFLIKYKQTNEEKRIFQKKKWLKTRHCE
jgi:hypothetical protein